MKTLLKHYLVDTVSLYLVSLAVSGIVFEKGIETILLAGVALMISSLIVKPVINLLILPINLITFGLFKWVASVVALYIVTLVVPGFKILGFRFAGYSSPWIDVPSFELSGFLAYIGFSLLLSILASFLYWLLK